MATELTTFVVNGVRNFEEPEETISLDGEIKAENLKEEPEEILLPEGKIFFELEKSKSISKEVNVKYIKKEPGDTMVFIEEVSVEGLKKEPEECKAFGDGVIVKPEDSVHVYLPILSEDIKTEVSNSNTIEPNPECTCDISDPDVKVQYNKCENQATCPSNLTKVKEITFKCDWCDYHTKDKSDLNRHTYGVHEGSVVCNMCNYRVLQKAGKGEEDKYQYMRAYSKMIERGQYLCLICSKRTTHYGNMKEHFTSHHWQRTGKYKGDEYHYVEANSKMIEGGQYLCLICSKITIHYGNMKKHFISHHWSGAGLENLILPCQYCGRRFKKSNSLASHVSQNHKQERHAEKAGQLPGNHY